VDAASVLATADVGLYAQLLAAADARRSDTALFERALASPARALRVEAVRAAGQVHATGAASMLRRTLADPDTAVAATAAYALGLLRDTASVSALVSALHGAPTTGAEAAWALGEIGERARGAIESALHDRRSVARPVQVDLLLASAKLRPVPVAAVAPYLAPATGAEPAVVRAAAYALARQRAAGGVRALAALATSADADTRLSVARGVARSAAGDSLAALALGALGKLVSDSDAHVRAVAVQSAASYGTDARGQVIAALHDPDANVRVSAAGVLDRVLGNQRSDWTAAYASDTSFPVRRAVVVAASRTGIALDAIDDRNPVCWQRRADWQHRAAAADAAVGTSLDRIGALALPLIRDMDARVRLAAYNALAPWLDSADASGHRWPRPSMAQALKDADPYVRTTALQALAGKASAADAEAALSSYERARRDSVADARVAAIQLLAAAWSRDSTMFSNSLREAARRLAVPEDPRELAAAGRGTIWSAWQHTPPPPAPHPIVWYDSVVRAVVLPSLAGHPYTATVVTQRGPLTITLLGDAAPLTVANFIALARGSSYRGTTFHRVVPTFVVQDGDPRGDGNGGPSYAIRDEFNRARYGRGTVGMALSGPDTGGSQYFLTLTPQPHLDGHYTVFGVLRDGYQALDQIVQGDTVSRVVVP